MERFEISGMFRKMVSESFRKNRLGIFGNKVPELQGVPHHIGSLLDLNYDFRDYNKKKFKENEPFKKIV